jgi:hypothetical protein
VFSLPAGQCSGETLRREFERGKSKTSPIRRLITVAARLAFLRRGKLPRVRWPQLAGALVESKEIRPHLLHEYRQRLIVIGNSIKSFYKEQVSTIVNVR